MYNRNLNDELEYEQAQYEKIRRSFKKLKDLVESDQHGTRRTTIVNWCNKAANIIFESKIPEVRNAAGSFDEMEAPDLEDIKEVLDSIQEAVDGFAREISRRATEAQEEEAYLWD